MCKGTLYITNFLYAELFYLISKLNKLFQITELKIILVILIYYSMITFSKQKITSKHLNYYMYSLMLLIHLQIIYLYYKLISTFIKYIYYSI